MSERTLRRHLIDPGMTYSGPLDRIRHEPACDLLQNTAMSIVTSPTSLASAMRAGSGTPSNAGRMRC